MEIKTKYSLNDFVYPIFKGGYEKYEKCELCNGNGEVLIANTERETACPDCYGQGGMNKWQEEKWRVSLDSASKIGKVSVELYANRYKSHKDEIRYMLQSTGVGSGTLWSEENLFATEIEAQGECDRRNSHE